MREGQDVLATIVGTIILIGAVFFMGRCAWNYAEGPVAVATYCPQCSTPHVAIGGFFFVRL